MKKIFLFLSFIFFFCFSSTGKALESEDVLITGFEKTNDKFFIQKNTLYDKDINGDTYFAGTNFSINSNVSGDIIGAASSINISGTIENNIRVVGNDINISDATAKNLTLGGEEIIIKGINANNVYAAASTFKLEGSINSLRIVCKETIINGTIDGDSYIYADKVTIKENAIINGNLTIKSPNEIIYDNYTDTDNIKYIKKDNVYNRYNLGRSIPGMIFRSVSMSLLALIIMVLFSKFVSRSIEQLKEKKGASILWGVLWFFGAPIIAVLSFVTIIGSTIGFVIALLYIFILLISSAFSAIALGSILFNDMNKYLRTYLGALIITVLGVIPVINFFTWLICFGYTLSSLKLLISKD